jgi:hypothetical protein
LRSYIFIVSSKYKIRGQDELFHIHNNPVVAGIVLSAEDYLYSSALNYTGRPEKLMEVMLA